MEPLVVLLIIFSIPLILISLPGKKYTKRKMTYWKNPTAYRTRPLKITYWNA